MDWRTAYLEQAAADYETFRELVKIGSPFCHQLHYLQMTTEKLAKGFLTSPGGPRYPKVHKAFVRFVIIAQSRFEFRRASRFKDTSQFRAYMDSLRHKAQQIEDLSPEGEEHPNPEYPWEIRGVIQTPLIYPFPDLNLKNPQMMKLLQFIEDCLAMRNQ
jgi:hypothetical protein